MTERSHSSDAPAGSSRGSSPRGTPPSAPRWVKASAIIVGVLILVVLILKFTGVGGDHGPGRHGGAGAAFSAGIVAVVAFPGEVARNPADLR